MPSIPYQFRFEANAVDELRTRIAQTRWPRRFTAQNWDFGVDQDYLRDVVDYWRDGFDFEDAERRINAVPNYLTSIDGLPIHHLHSRSAQEDAVPVLLLHGWPGSIVEFLEVIPKLSAPESAELESFHVVAPSLQGFGASPGIGEPGMTPVRIAHRMAALMRELGYEQFVVHGGDWGTLLATHIASLYPQRVLGLHVTLTHPIPPGDVPDAMALVQDHEREWLKGNEFNALDGRGYFEIQKTRPETLGFALNDSPAGWCAWVLDKFYQWTDCERDGIRDVRHAVSWEKFWQTCPCTGSLTRFPRPCISTGSSTWRCETGPGRPARSWSPPGLAFSPKKSSSHPGRGTSGGSRWCTGPNMKPADTSARWNSPKPSPAT